MSLTSLWVKHAKPGEKPTKHTDSHGLYLLIQPNGSKLWRYDYRFAGKRKTLALGQYDKVSLAMAREKRDEAREMLSDGRDPINKRISTSTSDGEFKSVADRWMAMQRPTLAAMTWDRKLGQLEKNVFPYIGTVQLSALREGDMLTVLRRIEDRGSSYSARRLRGYCSEIFLFGAAEGHCLPDHDPCEKLARVLQKPPKVVHQPAVATAEIPALLVAIDGYDGELITKLALKWTMLTMVRSTETRLATWSEFEGLDSKEPLWRIPAERMKARLEHIVPLPPQAVSLLTKIRRTHANSTLLFPGRSGNDAMSANTMIFALYRIGYHSRQSVHGFRRLASTWLNSNGQNSDWVERQLAHADPNKIRAAYNSAEWLPERRKMMALWADTLDDMLLEGRLG